MHEMPAFIEQLYSQIGTPKTPDQDEPAVPEDALVIGTDPGTGESRYLTSADLETSMLIAGGPGRGKSVATRTLLRQKLEQRKRTGAGFTLIDPGNTAGWLLFEIASRYPELAPVVYYSDLSAASGSVLSYNHLAHVVHPHHVAANMAEELVRTGGVRSTMEKPLVTKVLKLLIQTLIELGLTLADAVYFLESGPVERAVAQHLLEQLPESNRLRRYWSDLTSKSKQTQEISVLGPSLRLELVHSPALRRMIAAPLSASFNPLPVMDAGGIGIFNLSMTNAGVTKDERNTWASILIQGYTQAYPKRHADHALKHTLVIDEAGLLLPRNSGFEECVVEARKFSMTNVLICQQLSQLVHDDDTSLLDTCMALPTKLIFGNLPLNDCKIFAEDLYIRELDVMRVKYQHKHTVHDPVLRKVLVNSWTEGESETESESEGVTRSTGTTEGTSTSESMTDGTMTRHSISFEPGDMVPGQRMVGRGTTHGSSHGSTSTRSTTETEANSVQRGTATTTSRSKTTAEQWITDHIKRIEEDPEFMRLEEQVHLKAQHLRLLPRGQAVLLRPDESPCDVRIDNALDHDLTLDQIDTFLETVFDKPCYGRPEEIDRLIAEREVKLLEAAQPVVIASPKMKRKVTLAEAQSRRRSRPSKGKKGNP